MIEFGHGTHPGLHRRLNEDTCYADPSLGLFLVSDGMGGHAHGERAAALARDTVVEQVRRGAALADAIRHADRCIIGQHERSSRPMGSTLAALRLRSGRFEAVWVGDSRIYLHNGGLYRLSHDQTQVQQLVDAGLLDEREAGDHPHRNVLTQALGITAPDQLLLETARGCIAPGSCFLLCSDGLTEEVADASLADTLARDDIAAQEAVDHLLLAALDAGGHDNVTAIVVRCHPD